MPGPSHVQACPRMELSGDGGQARQVGIPSFRRKPQPMNGGYGRHHGDRIHHYADIGGAIAGRVLTYTASSNKVKPTMQDTERYEFTVRVKTAYLEEQSVPEDNRFVFAYTISITNTGSVPATLLRRHWVITDANNKVQEVHGDGVVGEQPRLNPGQTFQYTSGAILETPVGCMEGEYDILAEDGVEFASPIPIFNLSTPYTLH